MCSREIRRNYPFKIVKVTTISKRFVFVLIETVSPEGTFCDPVQVPFSADDMELYVFSIFLDND